MLHFAGTSFSSRLGGECMQNAAGPYWQRYCIAVCTFGRHSFEKESENSAPKTRNSNNGLLLQSWRGAADCGNFSSPQAKRGRYYPILAEIVEDKARLLMRVTPFSMEWVQLFLKIQRTQGFSMIW